MVPTEMKNFLLNRTYSVTDLILDGFMEDGQALCSLQHYIPLGQISVTNNTICESLGPFVTYLHEVDFSPLYIKLVFMPFTK